MDGKIGGEKLVEKEKRKTVINIYDTRKNLFFNKHKIVMK